MGLSLHVEVRPIVWSLCMCDRKKRRVPGHFRTCQKSTASGVCGITFPFIDMSAGLRLHRRSYNNQVEEQVS